MLLKDIRSEEHEIRKQNKMGYTGIYIGVAIY